MEVEDEPGQIVTYETEGEGSDEIQYVEYEQIEYLEGDNASETTGYVGMRTEASSENISYYCMTCEESFKTEFGMQHHSYFYHLKGQSEF
jgi:hypothetical protein